MCHQHLLIQGQDRLWVLAVGSNKKVIMADIIEEGGVLKVH